MECCVTWRSKILSWISGRILFCAELRFFLHRMKFSHQWKAVCIWLWNVPSHGICLSAHSVPFPLSPPQKRKSFKNVFGFQFDKIQDTEIMRILSSTSQAGNRYIVKNVHNLLWLDLYKRESPWRVLRELWDFKTCLFSSYQRELCP